MREDLSDYDVLAISNELNRYTAVMDDNAGNVLRLLDARGRRAGIVTTLELLGFAVTFDESGRVNDIVHRYV